MQKIESSVKSARDIVMEFIAGYGAPRLSSGSEAFEAITYRTWRLLIRLIGLNHT